MAESGKIEIPIEARVTIRVGEHDVELAELAAALTRAGIELQALVKPQPKEPTTVPTLPGPGEALARDQSGALHLVKLREFVYRPHSSHEHYPPVSLEGVLVDTITE